MPNYEKLSKEVTERIAYDKAHGIVMPYASTGHNVVRRNPLYDKESVWRPSYARDVDKIMHSPFYNRYTDKTQVFSFYKNDDISRRALHVQLVSRIARSIGSVLGLNLDLIEAIALGHDIGHTPFGHAGEKYLSESYFARTGRYFNHNIHSVRVLDSIFPLNITLDTLDGIASHNGELELTEYHPKTLNDFSEFDRMIEGCYTNENNILSLIPSTLEGCVVRVCDIIAYLGKDRQDALRARMIDTDSVPEGGIGTINAEIINNLVVNIIENSYGCPYIRMDEEHFEGLKKLKRENYEQIYMQEKLKKVLDGTVRPVMQRLYDKLLFDLTHGMKSSPIFSHHLDFVGKLSEHYSGGGRAYSMEEPNQIVVDYLASMTDDYCTELYEYLFPDSEVTFKYHGYFEDLM